MSHPVSTQFELRLAGISLIVANLLWIIAFWLQTSIDHDLFAIATDEQVIKLHDAVSSSGHRAKVHFSCVLLWMAFPLLLAAIHGIKKLAFATFQDTPGEVLMYIAEKAFILGIGIGLVFVPAISLTSVSYDWDWESRWESASGRAPTGYWIQLYLMIYLNEIIDCLAICDATFMLSYFSTAAYFVWAARNGRNTNIARLNEVVHGFGIYKKIKCFLGCLTTFCCVSLTVVFLMILFEFADSGFFSPNSSVNAGMLVMWSFLCKMFIGIRTIQIARIDQYREIKKILGEKSDDDDGEEQLNDTATNYKMEEINVGRDIDDPTAE